MKKILTLAFALLYMGTAFGQVKKVAILEPTVEEGLKVSPIQKKIVLGALEKAITNIDGYNAFTRTDIDAIDFEQEFQRSGKVDEVQRKKLGNMSGVDYIIVSILTPDEESGDLYIKCTLIEMESGLLDNSDNELMKMSSNSAIDRSCKCLAVRLLTREPCDDLTGEQPQRNTSTQQKKAATGVGINFPGVPFTSIDPKDGDTVTCDEANNTCKSKGDNWRLPSKDELLAIYRYRNRIIGSDRFRTTTYWTISGRNNYSMYVIDFSDGSATYMSKSNRATFRCVGE